MLEPAVVMADEVVGSLGEVFGMKPNMPMYAPGGGLNPNYVAREAAE